MVNFFKGTFKAHLNLKLLPNLLVSTLIAIALVKKACFSMPRKQKSLLNPYLKSKILFNFI